MGSAALCRALDLQGRDPRPHRADFLDGDEYHGGFLVLRMFAGQSPAPPVECFVLLHLERHQCILWNPLGNFRMVQDILLKLEYQLQILLHHRSLAHSHGSSPARNRSRYTSQFPFKSCSAYISPALSPRRSNSFLRSRRIEKRSMWAKAWAVSDRMASRHTPSNSISN